MVLEKRIRTLDFIKGIAMVMVILVHYEQSFNLCKWFYYLQMGCPIFFVCSGFGQMILINKKFPNIYDNVTEIRSFYISRIKALGPGWYLAFIVIFGINTILIYATGHTLSFGSNREPLSVLINLIFLNGLFPFCNNNVMPGGWYIGATAILYFITPYILILLRKLKKRRVIFVSTSFICIIIWIFLSRILKGDFFYNGFSYFIFLVHYPEYLLGIMLYFDMREGYISKNYIKYCLPLGIITFLIAYALFYTSIIFHNILSAWTTGLATYLVLYNLIFIECTNNLKINNKILNVLSSFGRKSYTIFLIHIFFAWSFIMIFEKSLNFIGLSIYNPVGFVIMIPVVLFLCYITGTILGKVLKIIQNIKY